MRILIYGLAKSGTTALHIKIKAGMEAHFKSDITEVFESVRREGNTLYKRDDSKFELTEHTLVKSLLPAVDGKGASPESILSDYADFDKKIFIARDPRDRWISAFFYRWYHMHNPNKEEFERAHRLTEYKEQHPSDIPFYSLFSTKPSRNDSWATRQLELHEKVKGFLTKAKEQDWFVLKYEDLMDGNLNELEKYLGLSLSEENKNDQRFSHVARSKKHGNWRRWFTEDDVEFYQPVFNDYLEFVGYDIKDWKLMRADHLPAQEGSAYMYKLFHGHHHKHHSKKKGWRKLFR